MYLQQIKKVEAALAKLPEDLAFDYSQEFERLKKVKTISK